MMPLGSRALDWEGVHLSSFLGGALGMFLPTLTQAWLSQRCSEGMVGWHH